MNIVVNKVINKVKYCKNIVKVNLFYFRKIIQCILDRTPEGKMLFVGRKSIKKRKIIK